MLLHEEANCEHFEGVPCSRLVADAEKFMRRMERVEQTLMHFIWKLYSKVSVYSGLAL